MPSALAIRRDKLPPDTPWIVQSLLHLGLAEYVLHHAEGAKANWDEALQRALRAWPDGGTELAQLRKVVADPDAALQPRRQ